MNTEIKTYWILLFIFAFFSSWQAFKIDRLSRRVNVYDAKYGKLKTLMDDEQITAIMCTHRLIDGRRVK